MNLLPPRTLTSTSSKPSPCPPNIEEYLQAQVHGNFFNDSVLSKFHQMANYNLQLDELTGDEQLVVIYLTQ